MNSSVISNLAVAALLLLSVPATVALIRRARKADAKRDRIAHEANVRPDLDARDPAETRPGTDLGVQDALELLYSMPAYGETTTDHTTAEGDL